MNAESRFGIIEDSAARRLGGANHSVFLGESRCGKSEMCLGCLRSKVPSLFFWQRGLWRHCEEGHQEEEYNKLDLWSLSTSWTYHVVSIRSRASLFLILTFLDRGR